MELWRRQWSLKVVVSVFSPIQHPDKRRISRFLLEMWDCFCEEGFPEAPRDSKSLKSTKFPPPSLQTSRLYQTKSLSLQTPRWRLYLFLGVPKLGGVVPFHSAFCIHWLFPVNLMLLNSIRLTDWANPSESNLVLSNRTSPLPCISVESVGCVIRRTYFSKDAISHCPCFCYDFQHFWTGSMWLHVERSVILSLVHVILAFVIRARGSFSFKISFPQAHFKGCWLARSSTLELNFKSLNNSPQSLRYVLTLRISGIFNAFL